MYQEKKHLKKIVTEYACELNYHFLGSFFLFVNLIFKNKLSKENHENTYIIYTYFSISTQSPKMFSI